MISRIQLFALLFVSFMIYGLVLFFAGKPVSWQWIKYWGLPFTLVSGLLFIFDKWFWKWPFWKGWLVHSPDISGVWKVEIKSSYKDPIIGNISPPKEGFMVIRQRFSMLKLRLLTDEMDSETLTANFVKSEDEFSTAYGIYQSNPFTKAKETNEMHRGALKLKVGFNPSPILEGEYWTNRKDQTRGDLKLSDRKIGLYPNTFEEAKTFFL